jgi:predicted ABC-type ATPase
MIDSLKKAGYDVHILYADLPEQEAQKREEARYRKDKRRVGADVLKRLHRGAIETFGKLAHAGHSVTVFNTNVPEGTEPPVVYQHSRDTHFEDAKHLRDMESRGHTFMRNLPGRG